jgi:hypothetical protein
VSRHWRTGEILALAHSSRHVAEKFTQARTHRVPVLNVLLSNVPAGTIQYGRSVLGTEVTEDGVRVNFKDSEPETFDLVVAADGIYSVSVTLCKVYRKFTVFRKSDSSTSRRKLNLEALLLTARSFLKVRSVISAAFQMTRRCGGAMAGSCFYHDLVSQSNI